MPVTININDCRERSGRRHLAVGWVELESDWPSTGRHRDCTGSDRVQRFSYPAAKTLRPPLKDTWLGDGVCGPSSFCHQPFSAVALSDGVR